MSTNVWPLQGRLPPATVLRAPLRRPQRCARRSPSSATLVWYLLACRTATRRRGATGIVRDLVKTLRNYRKTSLSGIGSTNTPAVLVFDVSGSDDAPIDSIGRANAVIEVD